MTPEFSDMLSPADVFRVNALVDRFEDEWDADPDRRPQIENMIAEAPELRSVLLAALIRQEVDLRRRASESPSVEEYELRFPEFGKNGLALAFLANGSELDSASQNDGKCPPPGGPGALAERFGRYEVIEFLGGGGMGEVYRVRDLELNRDLALKAMKSAHKGQVLLRRRFIEEAQVTGQLQHPGIPPVFERGELDDGRLYLTMKLVRGQTWNDLLRNRPDSASDQPRHLAIARHVAETVAYAHSKRVIHRDLKPLNVMVGAFGEVQVMDWGATKVLGAPGSVPDSTFAEPTLASVVDTERASDPDSDTQAGTAIGTYAYMPPEQAEGLVERVNARADVFALGSILCEVLTGAPAYTGRTGDEVRRKARLGDLADAKNRLHDSGADANLVKLALECLAPEPGDRPRDARAVATRLADHQSAVEERLRAAELARVAAQTRADGERRQRRLALALVGSVLGLILFGATMWIDRAARHQRTRAVIDVELTKASNNQDRAKAEPTRAVTFLTKALEHAQRARSHAFTGEVNGLLRSQTEERIAEVDTLLAAARQQESLVESLAIIPWRVGLALDPERADREYAEAFRKAGFDIDHGDPKSMSERLIGRDRNEEVALALDDWLFVLRQMHYEGSDDRRQRVARLADLIDTDPRSQQIRRYIGEGLNGAADLGRIAKEMSNESSRSRPIYLLLARALADHPDKMREAIDVMRQAWRFWPDDFWINQEMGELLLEGHRRGIDVPEKAVRYLHGAVVVQKGSAPAHYSLGMALLAEEDTEGAVEELKTANRLRPGDGILISSLAQALTIAGRPAEALARVQEAVKIRPNDAFPKHILGDLLRDADRTEEALEQYRQATVVAPGDVNSLCKYGVELEKADQFEESIRQYRAGMKVAPDDPFVLCHLGRFLCERGDFEEGLPLLRRGHELGMRRIGWVLESASWLAKIEEWVKIGPRLNAILRGDERPKDTAEARIVADCAYDRHRHSASARIVAEAFSADPDAEKDLATSVRYNAACSAARAGTGRSLDAPNNEADRAKLRWRALGWLKDDLDARSKALDAGPPTPGQDWRSYFRHCRDDADFAGVHKAGALAKLPEDERAAWKALWERVDLLARSN
jgi:eukaryotic-like serine/threonine-protein kinase